MGTPEDVAAEKYFTPPTLTTDELTERISNLTTFHARALVGYILGYYQDNSEVVELIRDFIDTYCKHDKETR